MAPDESIRLWGRRIELERRDRLLSQSLGTLVTLMNHADHLIAQRFYALLFVTSFLAVAWVSADGGSAEWVRPTIAIGAILLTALVWRINYVAVDTLSHYRSLAVSVERSLFGEHPGDPCVDFSVEPLGLHRFAVEKKPPFGPRSRLTDHLLHGHRRLGAPNTVMGRLVPIVLVLLWSLALFGGVFGLTAPNGAGSSSSPPQRIHEREESPSEVRPQRAEEQRAEPPSPREGIVPKGSVPY